MMQQIMGQATSRGKEKGAGRTGHPGPIFIIEEKELKNVDLLNRYFLRVAAQCLTHGINC